MIRRLVVAALVVLLAFSLSGCGGGGEEAAAPPAGEQAAAPPPAPDAAAAGTTGELADRSAEETVVFEPFPTGDFVPAAVTKRLESKPKQPMLLFFYDDAQLESDDARAEVSAVRKENAGAIDVLEFNIGKYTSVDTSGVASVKSKLDDDEQGQQAVTLARELGVTFTPFVVIVDDQGYVIFKWRGYIDAEMLGRQVERTKE